MTHQPHQSEDATLKPLASNSSAPECSCGHSLAAGAYGGWWCPVHKDMRPAKYAVDAVREVNAKYLAAANAVPLRPKPTCTKCGDSGWKPNLDANGERVWTPLMNDALPCECGALASKIAPGVLDWAGVCAVLERHFGKGAPMAGNLAAALDSALLRAAAGVGGKHEA